MTCWVTSCPFISTPGILTFPIWYRSVISISFSSSSESTSGNYTSPSFELAPTPGVSLYPMIWTLLSVKVRSLDRLPPNVFLRVIAVSGMGIKSQFLRIIYCLNSMLWTCIWLEYSQWYRGRFSPWFLELGYYVGYTPHAPDSNVLVTDIYAFWSVRSRL